MFHLAKLEMMNMLRNPARYRDQLIEILSNPIENQVDVFSKDFFYQIFLFCYNIWKNFSWCFKDTYELGQ